MRPNNVKALWRSGKPVLAGWMSLADSYAAEAMGNAGFDALVLDMQHGMAIGPERMAQWLQAVSLTPAVPFVRVPWNEPAWIQYALDAGAYGIIVPLIGSKEEAAKAAGACRYAPLGYRSVGPNRARYYGGSDYIQRANEEIVCLLMIEDVKTLQHLDAIAKTPGIDGLYIGPMDLAMTLGIDPTNYLDNSAHVKARRQVLEAARAHNLAAGCHAFSPEEAVRHFNDGFRFAPITSDTRNITSGSNLAIKTVRAGIH